MTEAATVADLPTFVKVVFILMISAIVLMTGFHVRKKRTSSPDRDRAFWYLFVCWILALCATPCLKLALDYALTPELPSHKLWQIVLLSLVAGSISIIAAKLTHQPLLARAGLISTVAVPLIAYGYLRTLNGVGEITYTLILLTGFTLVRAVSNWTLDRSIRPVADQT